MIDINLEVFVFLYLLIGLTFICGLWFFYDRRDRNLYEKERTKVVFYCIKCGKLYSGRRGLEEKACPSCEFQNGRLKY